MSIQDEFPPESHWITDHQLTDAYTRLRARAVEMEKALAEAHPALEDLCLSLDDSCTLMQSLGPATKQTGSTEHIVAGLMAQERLKRLCLLLGHETSRKLTGTLPPAP